LTGARDVNRKLNPNSAKQWRIFQPNKENTPKTGVSKYMENLEVRSSVEHKQQT
jgi:hypothetical protein